MIVNSPHSCITDSKNHIHSGDGKSCHAIRAEHGEDMPAMPVFFGREEFHYLMYLNGEEAVDPDSLPENVRGIIGRLTEKCTGGCLVQGITEDGDFLRPDPKLCWFFRNKGAGAVKEVADAAISRIKQ